MSTEKLFSSIDEGQCNGDLFYYSIEIGMETKVNKEDIDAKLDIKMETEISCDESEDKSVRKKEEKEIKYFQCFSCIFKQSYDYFGRNPPQVKNYILLEDAYVIEDPFIPPKQGKVIIVGAHCIKCRKAVCKDTNCSIYFDGTFCIECAKNNIKTFPLAIQEKLNRIIST